VGEERGSTRMRAGSFIILLCSGSLKEHNDNKKEK
jgi:hypothetical protein